MPPDPSHASSSTARDATLIAGGTDRDQATGTSDCGGAVLEARPLSDCARFWRWRAEKCRRAQAYIQLADLDLAKSDIKHALEIDPENRDVKLEYKASKEKIREYNKKEAKFYGNIFAKMSK